MKKLLIIILSIVTLNSYTQVSKDEIKRKFTFGLDVFSDLWQDIPSGISPQTINTGVNIFGAYNYMLGKSDFSFSPGLGLGVHNLYSTSFLKTQNNLSYFVEINDTIPDLSFKKSKMTITYLDIPIELRFKSESEFRIAIGFKFGFLMQAHTKYKGNDYIEDNPDRVIYKKSKIQGLEKNRYGFTARLGYKWLNLWGYYQLSTLFVSGKGPEMYPISLGLTIIPY
jgi:hypothetical protein